MLIRQLLFLTIEKYCSFALVKVFSLILAITLFSQSLSVCGSKLMQIHQKELQGTSCEIDIAGKKSCCKTKHTETQNESNHQDSNKKDCCEDGCHCLCCAKVFLPTLKLNTPIILTTNIKKQKSISPIYWHGFDFHNTLYHPPKVLS